MEQKAIHKKTLRGTVVSRKMRESAVVAVNTYVKHAKYKKYFKKTKRFIVHNPGDRAQEGEAVTIRSCRPLSRHKHFEIVFEN